MNHASRLVRRPCWRTLLAGLGCGVALSGCQASALVDLTLDRDGSGLVGTTVTLDKTAAGQVDATQLAVGDLRSAGWSVTTDEQDDGGLIVRVARRVNGADQATGALAQLGAPFSGLTVQAGGNPFVDDVRLNGSVDLSAGVDAFGDAVVTERTGSPLGVSPDEIARQAGRPLDSAFEVALVADLAGGTAQRWDLPLGEQTVIQAQSRHLAWEVVGPVAAIAACVLIAVAARRFRS